MNINLNMKYHYFWINSSWHSSSLFSSNKTTLFTITPIQAVTVFACYSTFYSQLFTWISLSFTSTKLRFSSIYYIATDKRSRKSIYLTGLLSDAAAAKSQINLHVIMYVVLANILIGFIDLTQNLWT